MQKKTFSLLLLLISSFATLNAVAQTQWDTAVENSNENSLPLVNISVETAKLSKAEYIGGVITIFDKEKRTEGQELACFDCMVRYRGATSVNLAKKSFAVKLIDQLGKDLDANIFGIRSENSWILDAMAIDRIRMRNRVIFDAWNEMSRTPYETSFGNRNGTLGQYVELYLNGEYHGLYCMSDKIDRKLLGLKKAKVQSDGSVNVKGVLYKGINWTEATYLGSYDTSESFDEDVWNGWELQYPDDYPCYDAWKPLMDLIDLANTSTDNLKQHYQEHLYHDNVVDYALLLMAHNILDNNMKNLHISCVNVNEHETFLFTPWDLDCSLGGYWDGSHYDYTTNPSILTCNRLYTKILSGNVEDFCGSLKKRWMELSAGILSTERFNSRLDAYAQAFKESGAWERERNKWNNNPVPLDLEEELAYVKDWYVRNMSQMNYLFEVPTDHVPFVLQNPEGNEQVIYSLDGKRQIFQPRTGGVFIVNGRKVIRK